MPTPKDNASILSESVNTVEASDESHIFTRVTNEMSKEAVSVVQSTSAEKPNLTHFRVRPYSFRQLFICIYNFILLLFYDTLIVVILGAFQLL